MKANNTPNDNNNESDGPFTDAEKSDFIAAVSYSSIDDNGIKSPVSSGYRAKIAFEFIEKQGLCEQLFADDALVYAGDTIEAGITLLGDAYYENKLTTGASFELFEGSKLIATGIIKQVLNSKLRK